jgi:Domain of unknown function (DUF4843)
MKKIVLIVIASLALFSCSQNERMLYEEKPAVYFADMSNEADSVVFTFTTTAEDEATVNLKVTLLGALYEDRMYSVVVNPGSTAKEGVHYEALQEEYTYTAGKTSVNLPIRVMYNSDLDNNIVVLSVSLVANDQMDVGYPDKLTARIMLTNQLVKPSYWDSLLSFYFGEYSKVKHQILTDIMGHDFPATKAETEYYGDEYSIYGYWMHAGREAAEYFAKHTVYDENGNVIATWLPY